MCPNIRFVCVYLCIWGCILPFSYTAKINVSKGDRSLMAETHFVFIVIWWGCNGMKMMNKQTEITNGWKRCLCRRFMLIKRSFTFFYNHNSSSSDNVFNNNYNNVSNNRNMDSNIERLLLPHTMVFFFSPKPFFVYLCIMCI